MSIWSGYLFSEDDPAYASVETRSYEKIGRFIADFSQLEFSIRVNLMQALRLDHLSYPAELAEAITSPYSFTSLCKVAQKVFSLVNQADDTRAMKIAAVLNKCLALHEQKRNPLVHGIWAPSDRGPVARYTAQGTGRVSFHFENPDELDAMIREAQLT